MDARDYGLILDSLEITGIYVVRADDHRILYFNKRTQEAVPDIRLGAVCHELWGKCEHCPLIGIGDRHINHSINFDGPNGQAVDIVATRMLWQDEIPAYIIKFSPHVEAFNPTYSKIVKGNLTTNACEAIKMLKEERDALPAVFTLKQALETFAASKFLYPEDRERFQKFSALPFMRQEFRKGKKLLVCNYRRLAEDGYRWNTMEVTPDPDYTDTDQSIMIYVKDVQNIYREGLEHEHLNLKNEAILKSLGEENFGIYMVNLSSGEMELVRAAWEDRPHLGGKERDWDTLQERYLAPLYHPDYREKFQSTFCLESLKKAQKEKKEKLEMFAQRKIGGKYHYISITAHLYLDGEKKDYVLLAFEDVDDRIRKEMEQIRIDKERASIINSLSGMFLSTNYINLKSGVMRRIDRRQQVEKLLGEEKEYVEVVRKYAGTLVHPDDRKEYLAHMDYAALLEQLSQEHPTIATEFRELPEDVGGELRWLRATAVLAEMEDGHPKAALYVTQDITESKEKEMREREALQGAFEAANRANASKSEFLSRMSHDIRTPMNAIIGMTAIAGTHLDDRERIVDCLSKITVSSRHLLALINEVLDLSKIESGKVDFSEEEFNLSNLFADLLTIVQPSVRAKKQELEIKVCQVEHEDVIGDTLRLQQVFTNILSNAVKYTGTGGKIEIEIYERPAAARQGYSCYEFVFRDNGIGMSEEYQKHIFEPFSRAEDSRTSKVEGTGLGMLIARNIVQMMNGDIRVKSQENVGSEFTVTLFLKLQNAKDTDLSDLADLRVLVADDDQTACETTCHVLEEIGMKGEWVLSGEEAVQTLETARGEDPGFFAVILDWKMPGMDGLETARQIRRRVGPEVPIIILSAYDWSEVEEEAKDAGVDGFVSKPLFKSRLVYLFKQFTGGEERTRKDEEAFRTLEQRDYSGKRILLAEDNELNREIATEIIGMTGVQIECAVNGKEAVELFEDHPENYYDMIFMDIRMPVMDGHEAAKAIRAFSRADAKSIPIIAMTADAFTSDIRASRRSGMNEHIIKPLNFGALTKCMDKWLYKES